MTDTVEWYWDQQWQSAVHMYISLETDGTRQFLDQKVVRIALVLTDATHQVMSLESFFVQGATQLGYNPNRYSLSQVANGLDQADAKTHLMERIRVIQKNRGTIVAHNLQFVGHQFMQLGINLTALGVNSFCIMKGSTEVCRLVPLSHGQYKYPKLIELCRFLEPQVHWRLDALQKAEDKAWAIQCCYKTLVEKYL